MESGAKDDLKRVIKAATYLVFLPLFGLLDEPSLDAILLYPVTFFQRMLVPARGIWYSRSVVRSTGRPIYALDGVVSSA